MKNMTSRELLVLLAGKKHDDHTVVGRYPTRRGAIVFVCLCGYRGTAPAEERYIYALRNVQVLAVEEAKKG